MIPSETSRYSIVLDAPATPQTIALSAMLYPLTNYDPEPANNQASVTTMLYDAPLCSARQLAIVAPNDRATLTDTHVTLTWSALPNVLHYNVYAPSLIAATNENQIIADFARGEVQWYVEAITSDCPPLASAPQRFTVVNAIPRRRATRS
jgi:hypothetical protein